jgi:hypothetical protein
MILPASLRAGQNVSRWPSPEQDQEIIGLSTRAPLPMSFECRQGNRDRVQESREVLRNAS